MIILQLVCDGTVLGNVHLPNTANMYSMNRVIQKAWKEFLKTQDRHALMVDNAMFMECLRQAGFILGSDESVQQLELKR